MPIAIAAIVASKPNGVILYEGPSMLDGASPIVIIATGIAKASSNAKTGAMVQTYILRSDVSPMEAIRTGADEAICGGCVHRGDGTGKLRSCYVVIAHGPRSVYDAFKRGVYPRATPAEARGILAGSMVRLGTYGDPAAAPLGLWQAILADAKGWTGYSHQWRVLDAAWRKLVMASADDLADALQARAAGWRTFRVTAEPFDNAKGETSCPASEEKGRAASCIACKACMGTAGKARASITIAAHGGGAGHAIRRAA